MELNHGDLVRFGKVEFLFSQNASHTQTVAPKTNFALGKIKVAALIFGVLLVIFVSLYLLSNKTSQKSSAALYEQALANQITQAKIFSEQEDWSGAKQIYERIIAQDPLNDSVQKELKFVTDTLDARALLKKGLELFNKDQLVEAALILQDAPENTPYDAALIQLKSNIRIKKEMTMQASAETQARLFAAQYPDTEVQYAARYYAEDKIDDAINHARQYIARAGASRLHRNLLAIRKLYKSSTLNEKKKAYLLAAGSIQSILALDREIIPKNCTNLFRQKIRKRLSDVLLSAGNVAWKNQSYEEAYMAWNKGFAAIPWDNRFAKGFAQLEGLAKTKLVALELNQDVHDKQTCKQLLLISHLTRPSSIYHRQAQAALKKCPSP